VLPYFVEEDIEYLKNSVEPELYAKMQFYKLKNPGKKVKEAEGKQEVDKKDNKGKQKQEAQQQQAEMAPQKEKSFEEMTTLGEILAYPDFGARMAYFPHIWIGLFYLSLYNNLVGVIWIWSTGSRASWASGQVDFEPAEPQAKEGQMGSKLK
jgi:hypothetical protein